jgi:hypothetical protein
VSIAIHSMIATVEKPIAIDANSTAEEYVPAAFLR